MSKSTIYYINIGGGVGNVGAFKYAWKAPKDSYDGIAAELGVKKANDNEPGLIYGANSPKPAKVRINYKVGTGANSSTRSVTRFCEPDQVSAVTTGGKLNNKKIKIRGKTFDIDSVTIAY